MYLKSFEFFGVIMVLYDIIISDWQMKPITGLELLKNIHQLPNKSTIPFLILTSHADKDKVILALESGISDYMVKPVNQSTLVNKINLALKSYKDSLVNKESV